MLFQKVIRPPPQLKDSKSSSSSPQQQQQQQHQLLLFLPSLVHYLQSTYALPKDLPMTYDIHIIENEQEEDYDADGSGHLDNSYSILEIKSPLVSSSDYRFHLYVEVVGIFTGQTNSDNNANSNALPTMAMVVIKSMKENNTQHQQQHGNDIIRLRLFQDSMQRIIQSIDQGLDSYMSGNVPLMEASSSSSNSSSSGSSNTRAGKETSTNIKDDRDDDGTWIGLDEYEGFDEEDTWDELQPIISTEESLMGKGTGTTTWAKDVVIDTVATSSDETEISKDDNNNNNNIDVPSNNLKKDQKEGSNTVISTDYAVLAAQKVMKRRKEESAKQQHNEKENESIHLDHGNDKVKKKTKSCSCCDSTHSETHTVTTTGGDFAVEAARQLAAQHKGHEEENAHDDSCSGSNSAVDDDNVFNNGDFAVESAKRIAKAMKSKIVTTTTNASSHEDNSPTFSTSPEPQISHGDSVDLEDMLPNLSPMITNRIDSKSKSFRVSISKPDKFSVRKNNKEKLKLCNDTDLRKNKSDGSSTNSANESIISKNSDSKQVTRKELNIVTDSSTVKPGDIPDQERQKVLNNLHLSSLTSISVEPPALDKEPETTGKKTKTREEIEQDIYKAALEIMPGETNAASQGDSNSNEGDISAEELLRDVLKFGEEQQKEETVGTGFVDGAFNKAKELISEEMKKQDGIQEVGYEEPSITNSAEDELKRIFEAGQSIADGHMTLSTGASSKEGIQDEQIVGQGLSNNNIVTNEYVDELIDADKTISRNSRSLDEELAELELRVSRAPDEDINKGNNAIFDVFSGPEVYNPNVDPESSVNWPGAQPGTRTDINLPPALDMAVKNARYASGLLKKIIKEKDENIEVENDAESRFFIDGKEISKEQIKKLQQCVEEGIAIGLIDDPYTFMAERSRLDMVVDELTREPDERFGEIIVNYKDLLLSENIVIIVKEKIQNLRQVEEETLKGKNNTEVDQLIEKHKRVRMILEKVVQYAQLLLKETRALGAELEATQLEIIRSICQVAMDPSHETEEETSIALTDAVRDLKPLLDESFVAYLKYAIAEEEGRLARSGVLDDPDHNRWLFVLKIVQEGVYAELSKGIQRYVDHISYVLRMKTKSQRRLLLSQLIDAMPSMDVRPFVKVVENIAASLGAGSKGDFDTSAIDSMTNQILQLRRDVHDLLPPERIKVMSKDADEWAARRRKKLLEQRGVSQQRLKAARESEGFDLAARRGEIERFD